MYMIYTIDLSLLSFFHKYIPRFPMLTMKSQADLQLIGQHVAWLQPGPGSSGGLPHRGNGAPETSGVTQRNFGTDGQRASKLPALSLGSPFFWGGKYLNCHHKPLIKDFFAFFGGIRRALINQLVSHNDSYSWTVWQMRDSRLASKSSQWAASGVAILNAQDAGGKVSGLHTVGAPLWTAPTILATYEVVNNNSSYFPKV